MKTEDILKELGFNHITGTLYKNTETNHIVSVDDEDTPHDLFIKIMNLGKIDKILQIKHALGIYEH